MANLDIFNNWDTISKINPGELFFEDPGTYIRVITNGGKVTAWVRCPKCAFTFNLFLLKIENDGFINKLLKCPNNGCTFQNYIQLMNWEIPWNERID